MVHYLTSVSSALHSFVSIFKMLSVVYIAVNTGPVMGSILLQAVFVFIGSLLSPVLRSRKDWDHECRAQYSDWLLVSYH